MNRHLAYGLEGPMPASTMPRRERKKHQTRQALEDTAWQLFTEQGYDATTITDITDRVDVAERTFFRYFDNKEAVLFGGWREDLNGLAATIRDRPHQEPPWDALRGAVLAVAEQYEADRERNMIRARLMTDIPTVSGYQRQVILPTWEDVLATALAQRLGVEHDGDLRPHAFAGAAVAAIHAAVVNWLNAGGHPSLKTLVGSAMDLLEPARR